MGYLEINIIEYTLSGLVGVMVSLIMVNIGKYVVRKGYIQNIYDWLYALLNSHEMGKEYNNLSPFQKKIIHQLSRNQSKCGKFKGQFGRYNESIYAADSSSDKPYMFFTYWVVFVLHKNRLCENTLLKIAIKGIKKLFNESNKIPVRSSAAGKSPYLINEQYCYRHTMAGAHILALVEGKNAVTTRVVGYMFDQKNTWQDTLSKGWKCNSYDSYPELWASVYAVKLLNFLIESNSYAEQSNTILLALSETLAYLEKEFDANQWKISDPQGEEIVSSDENLILLFNEIYSVLQNNSFALYSKCVKKIKEWIDEFGNIRETAYDRLQSITKYKINTRIAYSLFLIKDERWKVLFSEIKKSNSPKLGMVELAYLLDMSCVYKE
jgi:hypothetical protein